MDCWKVFVDLAGWAQFVGGVGAIIATWRIARSQHRAAMEAAAHERSLQGYAIAVALHPQLQRLTAALEAFESLNRLNGVDQPDAKVSRIRLDTGCIAVPTALEENRYNLYKLGGNAAILAHRLYGELLRYNEFTSNHSISFEDAEAWNIAGTAHEYVAAANIDVSLALSLCRNLSKALGHVIKAFPEASKEDAVSRWIGN